MKRTICLGLAVLSVAGCERVLSTELALLDQARRGIELTEQSIADRALLIESGHAAQRRELDRAFDADVEARGPRLDPAWVVRHRRAYALGLDAIESQRRSWERRTEADRRNLAAARAAIEQARALNAAQLALIPGPDETQESNP